jgi:hypothetical protein
MEDAEYIGGIRKGDLVSAPINGKTVLCELMDEPSGPRVMVRAADSGEAKVVPTTDIKDAMPRYFE